MSNSNQIFSETFLKLAFSYKGWKAGLDTTQHKTLLVNPAGERVNFSEAPEEVQDAHDRQGEGTFSYGGER